MLNCGRLWEINAEVLKLTEILKLTLSAYSGQFRLSDFWLPWQCDAGEEMIMLPDTKESLPNHHKQVILGTAIAICVLVVGYINIRLGVDQVYSHFFYLPIILTGIWYHKKAIYVALFLGAVHVYAEYIVSGSIIPGTIIRAAFFLGAALVIGHLSEERDGYYRALKISIKQQELILQEAEEGIFSLDVQGTVTFANPAGVKMVGCQPEDITGGRINLTQLLQQPAYMENKPGNTILNTLTKGVLSGSVEECIVDRFGKKITLEFTSKQIQEQGSVMGAIVVMRDITESVRVKKELARLDKLNLIGKMAAGLAHELRNPMTTVRGFLQMSIEKTEIIKREHMELMIEELDRANSIITEFLTLGKHSMINCRVQSLNATVEAVSELIGVSAANQGKQVRISLGKVPDILFDDGEIRQLIYNLVNNGLEATPLGGEVNISTYYKNSQVYLAVKDQGSGIEEEVLERMGTPFFTTKETGTGLGVAICYSIAFRHNATISVTTGSGGTTFEVKFPTTT